MEVRRATYEEAKRIREFGVFVGDRRVDNWRGELLVCVEGGTVLGFVTCSANLLLPEGEPRRFALRRGWFTAARHDNRRAVVTLARRMETTRLAPSPTGALHLGNARTFLVNWALARRLGWRVVLRIEDLDGPRVKRGADRAAVDDLRWLGIDWDGGPVRQSDRSAIYQAAADRLVAAGLAYPCVCTRREVESAASAPHAEDGSAVYPGTCRGRFGTVADARAAVGREPAVRFRVPDDAASAVVAWDDRFLGPQSVDARRLGDFVIVKADGTAAYQLAVVVDDDAAAVTQIVRGDDLVDSTPRQVLLYRALGSAPQVPTYCHLPLVTGPDGRRLAKRHGDTRLGYYRQQGVRPERVIALLARRSGIDNTGELVSATEFASRMTLEAMPRAAVAFTGEDDAWLRAAPRSK